AYTLLLASAMAFGSLGFVAGCEDTVYEKETTVERNGEVVKHDEVKVTRDEDGDVKKVETHTRDKD
ncbi:MAG: hypothetical protein ACREIT_03845, partial [Tepidisphaeraceae bacterium]